MLNVVLREDVKEYLKQHHHNDISLRLMHNDYSTGNVYTRSPRIRFKAPRDEQNFDSYMVDGVRVFVEKEIEAYDDTIEFVEETFLGIHRCHVKGVKLDSDIMI